MSRILLGMSGIASIGDQPVHVQVVGEFASGGLVVEEVGTNKQHFIQRTAFAEKYAIAPKPLTQEVRQAALSLSQAVERARSMVGDDRLLGQEDFQLLYDELEEADRFPFGMALIENGVQVRSASKSAQEQEEYYDPWSKEYYGDCYVCGNPKPERSRTCDNPDCLAAYHYDEHAEPFCDSCEQGKEVWHRKYPGNPLFRKGAVDLLTSPTDEGDPLGKPHPVSTGLGPPGEGAGAVMDTPDQPGFAPWSPAEGEGISSPSGHSENSYPWPRQIEGQAIPYDLCPECGFKHDHILDPTRSPEFLKLPTPDCECLPGCSCGCCVCKMGLNKTSQYHDPEDPYCNCSDCWWSRDQKEICPTCGAVVGEGCPHSPKEPDADELVKDSEMGWSGSELVNERWAMGMMDLVNSPKSRPKSPLEDSTQPKALGLEGDLASPSGRDRGLNPSTHEMSNHSYSSDNQWEDPDMHLGMLDLDAQTALSCSNCGGLVKGGPGSKCEFCGATLTNWPQEPCFVCGRKSQDSPVCQKCGEWWEKVKQLSPELSDEQSLQVLHKLYQQAGKRGMVADLGMDADWFSEMGPAEQQQYKKDHPRSKKSPGPGHTYIPKDKSPPGTDRPQPKPLAPKTFSPPGTPANKPMYSPSVSQEPTPKPKKEPKVPRVEKPKKPSQEPTPKPKKEPKVPRVEKPKKPKLDVQDKAHLKEQVVEINKPVKLPSGKIFTLKQEKPGAPFETDIQEPGQEAPVEAPQPVSEPVQTAPQPTPTPAPQQAPEAPQEALEPVPQEQPKAPLPPPKADSKIFGQLAQRMEDNLNQAFSDVATFAERLEGNMEEAVTTGLNFFKDIGRSIMDFVKNPGQVTKELAGRMASSIDKTLDSMFADLKQKGQNLFEPFEREMRGMSDWFRKLAEGMETNLNDAFGRVPRASARMADILRTTEPYTQSVPAGGEEGIYDQDQEDMNVQVTARMAQFVQSNPASTSNGHDFGMDEIGIAGDLYEPEGVGEGIAPEEGDPDEPKEPGGFGVMLSMKMLAQGVDNRMMDENVHTDPTEGMDDRGIQRSPEDEELRY